MEARPSIRQEVEHRQKVAQDVSMVHWGRVADRIEMEVEVEGATGVEARDQVDSVQAVVVRAMSLDILIVLTIHQV